MKLNLFTVLLTAVATVSARSIRFPGVNLKRQTSPAVTSLSASNHYGSPTPAWAAGYSPAWYLGNDPASAPGTVWLKDRNVCTALNKIPDSLHCPTFPLTLNVRAYVNAVAAKRDGTRTLSETTGETRTVIGGSPGPSQAPPPPPPPGVYDPVFSGLDGAIQADDYLTFGLVDSVGDCYLMCDTVPECGFVNTYHDVNAKDGSPLLTCSLFKTCHGAELATNKGGQSQPDGSVNFIKDSDGFCKK
ncbi:hypothetical protein PM082_023867 [Marasmius tenuissimus]|nr:hypothetical protein PM082_023867 [Marasmius tenuissimus]